MFRVAICCYLVLVNSVLFAQTFTGKVFDAKTKEAIPFANIGIASKGIGATADIEGNYTLQLSTANTNDFIIISMIGYKPLNISYAKFAQQFSNQQNNYYLDENTFDLKEVVIRPKKFITKVVGNTNMGAPCIALVGDTSKEDANFEIGTRIKVKHESTFVDKISFGICQNDFDSIILRVNVYNSNNENVLKKPIYVVAKKGQKLVSVDTKNYNIEIDNNFIIAIEAMNITQSKSDKNSKGQKKFMFSGGFFGSDLMMRKNLYSQWDKVNAIVVGFNATITYEDKGNWLSNLFR